MNVSVAESCPSGFAASSPYADQPTAPYVPIARTSSAALSWLSGTKKGWMPVAYCFIAASASLHIDVRSQEGERRSRGPPDIEHGGCRTPARVLAGGVLAGLRTEPGVRVHRDVGDRLAASREVLDVGGDGPGHEDLLRRGRVAEDLRPRPARRGCRWTPRVAGRTCCPPVSRARGRAARTARVRPTPPRRERCGPGCRRGRRTRSRPAPSRPCRRDRHPRGAG